MHPRTRASDRPPRRRARLLQWSDFVANFEAIYVCRVMKLASQGGPWHKYTAEGEWAGKAAGGCCNTPESAQWNPQWLVKPSRPCTVVVSVTQKPDPLGGERVAIGIMLVRKGGSRVKHNRVSDSLGVDSGYCAYATQSAEGRITPEAAPFTLFASTFEPGLSRGFVVTVYADAPLEMTDGPTLRRIPESVPAN